MKILDELKSAGFDFKKSLGQNYLLDEGFLGSLVKNLGLKQNETVVEVGTGAGTFTRAIARKVGMVKTFEVDKRLESVLQKQFEGLTNIELRFEDGLKSDNMPNELYKVVANIPYYITTPLLMKFMRDPNCIEINVLVQEEFGNRMVTLHGCGEYGALSVGVQSWGDVEIIKWVPRNMFVPRPNVDSVFVQVKKHDKYDNVDATSLEKLLKGLFSSRRKMITNGLGKVLGINREEVIKILYNIGIDENLRPEDISVEQYIALSNLLSSMNYKL